jgi:hypothetical protein
MQLYAISISVTLEAPFLIAGNDNSEWGRDIAQIRNQDGDPIIPDTHLRGVLSHAADGDTALARYLDNPRKSEEQLEAENWTLNGRNRRLIFCDLVAQGHRVSTGRSTRTRIDDETGTAKDGTLMVAELVAPPGELVAFSGTALLWADHQAAAAQVVKDLRAIKGQVEAIGRFKTVGWGRLVDMTFGDPKGIPSTGTTPVPLGAFDLTFQLDRPVLVDARRMDSNTMESAAIIPGNAIKGALSGHLERLGHDPRTGDLKRHLEEMVVGQARPVWDKYPLVGRAPSDLAESVRRKTPRTLTIWPGCPGCGQTSRVGQPRNLTGWSARPAPMCRSTLKRRRPKRVRCSPRR